MVDKKDIFVLDEEYYMFYKDFDDPLGTGAYADVCRCYKVGEADKPYAVKRMHKKSTKTNDMQQVIAAENAAAELLAQFKSCSYLPQVLKIIDTPDTMYYVMPLFNAGTLEKYIYRKIKVLKFPQVLTLFRHISEALALIHEKNIQHRDIKAENVFLHRETTGAKLIAVLADFGFAKQSSCENYTVLGTPLTMAPELHKQDTSTEKVDIWAIGAVLYKMCFGDYPFSGSDVRNAILKGLYTLPDAYLISSECIDLIEACLQDSPHTRISAQQIREHPFVTREPNEQNLYWITKPLTMTTKARRWPGLLADSIRNKTLEIIHQGLPF